MKRTCITTILTLATATAVLAHQGVSNPAVMARMQGMTAISGHLKTLGEMTKGTRAFDAATARAAAAGIAEHAAAVPALFKAPETDPKSEALPVIWDSYDTFTGLSDELQVLASELAQTISSPADLRPAMGALAANCKACHGRFRE
ncbi:cytochrome c [uncultured Roseobacter sp.]|uniref:c-type cytochrome n=1 Tax=uncultured Roseobacter sp. TaxID=114847 RepID=UPI00262A591F|nr:cytochrome c [uncultured Roseobacter sp.]